MNNNRQGASAQPVSRDEYRRLDNKVTCILQKRWPANEVRQWVAMLQSKQQALACAILRRRHSRPALLNLPATAADVPNPFQAKDSRPTVTVLSADGRYAGKRHVVEGRTPVAIDQCGTISCARTGRTHVVYGHPATDTPAKEPTISSWRAWAKVDAMVVRKGSA